MQKIQPQIQIKMPLFLALELELWNQRSDVMLSGMNTLSQQVFFECNIANMGAASYIYIRFLR